MSIIVDIAHAGDLVVAIGQGSTQKTARISSVIIKSASLVFRTMLGPSFQEGQTAHDAGNPLRLPDDDPIATLNFFHVVHHHVNREDKTETDWLQKLFIVCDKYDCIELFRTYFFFQVGVNKNVFHLHYVDRFIISGLIGDKEIFEHESKRIVRWPRVDVEDLGHDGLLQLLPKDALAQMSKYRQDARIDYVVKSHELMARIHTSGHELCQGLRDRLALFQARLVHTEVLRDNISEDTDLFDMRFRLMQQPLFDPDGGMAEIDEYICDDLCNGCRMNVGRMVLQTADQLDYGVWPHFKVCLECFRGNTFTFFRECDLHNAASVT